MAIHTDTDHASQCAVTSTSSAHDIVGGASYNKILAYNAGAVLVHYRVGGAGATATAYSANVGDPFIAPNTVQEIWSGQAEYIALITDSGTATVHVMPFEEMQR